MTTNDLIGYAGENEDAVGFPESTPFGSYGDFLGPYKILDSWKEGLFRRAPESREHSFQANFTAPVIRYVASPNICVLEAGRHYADTVKDALATLTYTAPAQVPDNLVTTAAELSDIIGRINNFGFDEEEDEFGVLRPSYHAQTHCLRLLLELAKDASLFQPTDITTDHNAAIRVSWSCEDREAELICPSESDQLPYLYFSTPDDYGTEADLTAKKVLEKTQWAMSGK